MSTTHPYRVCGVSRATWHGLVAASLPELRQKGCVKLSLNAAPDKVEVVLEEDGTIVDDDEYLQLLDKNSRLMLLQPGERWDRPRVTPAGVDDEVETDGGPLSQSEKVARMLHRDLGLIINLSDLQLRAVAEEQPEELARWLGGEEAAELVSGACGRVLDSRQQLRDVHSFVALYRRAEDHDRQLRGDCSRKVAAADDVADGRPPHPPPVVDPGPAEGDRRPELRPSGTLDAALLGQLAGGQTVELGLSTEQLECVTEAGPAAVGRGLGMSTQDSLPIVQACQRERESRCQQLLHLGHVRRSNPGPVKPGPVDPGPVDTGPVDTGPVDPGPVDPGPIDPGPVDPGVPTSRSSVDVKGNPFLPSVALLDRLVARRPTEPGLSMNELKRVMRAKNAMARLLGVSNENARSIMRACMREKNSRHQRLHCLEHIRSNPRPVDPGPVDLGPVDSASCSSVNVESDWWRRLRPSGPLTVALLGRLVDHRPAEPGLSMVELEQVIEAGVAAMAHGLCVSESDADNVIKTCQHEMDSRRERMPLLNDSRLSNPILSHRSVPLEADAKSGLRVCKRRRVMDQGSSGRPGEQQKEQEEEGPDCEEVKPKMLSLSSATAASADAVVADSPPDLCKTMQPMVP
ncbi:DNA fragmentation factor subunit alpha [Lampetra planeri]